MSVNNSNLSSNAYQYFFKLISWKNNNIFSVSTKLNIVNFLVIISGFLSIVGAYEIQMGGKMHELNYLHQKYITHLVKTVKEFETDINTIDSVEEYVLLIRQQPIDCLDLVGPAEAFMMALIKTDQAIQICRNDLQIANNLLQQIQAYKTNKIEKLDVLNHLYQSIDGFEKSGVQFEPLVGRTVKIIFFFVISIVTAKAFVVPVFGLLLSRSVSRDYQILSDTKISLEKEKKHSALIQSKRMVSLTTLVAGIAHEINTPVGVSITASSHSNDILNNIKQAYDAEELTEKEFCKFFNDMEKINDIIINNLLRTSTLIKSFKMVSTDQNIDELQTINFKHYIEQILISLSPLTRRSNITITLNCSKNLQGRLYGDALFQIITNIITNAIDHAFEGKQQGELLISVTQESKDEMLISFEDDGRGISEDNQIQIFEPFLQQPEEVETLALAYIFFII